MLIRIFCAVFYLTSLMFMDIVFIHLSMVSLGVVLESHQVIKVT